MTAEEQRARFQETFQAVQAAIGEVIVGHRETIREVLVCFLCGGHALLEGVPGLGKTLLVKTLAQCFNLTFSRISFTPDLMPADITGTNVLLEDEGGQKRFQFQPGPIFGNIVLADEINRATPKTQAALLEAMQEGAVTVSGVTHPLPQPFFVIATQNPIEMEGTFPLPEAQLDRFLFKLTVTGSNREELVEILRRTTGEARPSPELRRAGAEIMALRELVRQVPIAAEMMDYASRLVLATDPGSEAAVDETRRYVRYGSSPRGAQALVLAAKVNALADSRLNVADADLDRCAKPALRHRIILNFEGEAEGVSPERVIEAVLAATPAVALPVEKLLGQAKPD